MKQFLLIYSTFVALICAPSWQLHGQTVSEPAATVQFSAGQTVTVTDFSEPIGLAPNAVVQVTVALATTVAGERLSVGSLDGGRVISAVSAIAAQGNVSFLFQAGANVGLSRVELRHGAQKLRLQFWVLDTANPQNNPPVITPSNPQG